MTQPPSVLVYSGEWMPKLIIICGLSFAGKSTLGRAIADRLGYVEVDVDLTKTALYGSDIADDTLTHEHWRCIYAETDRQVVDLLKAGANVIDASRHFTRAERRQIRTLVHQHGYDLVTIYVNTSAAIARQRWQENRVYPSRRDVPDTDFEAIVTAMEPPTADEQPLLVYAGEARESWITQNSALLS